MNIARIFFTLIFIICFSILALSKYNNFFSSKAQAQTDPLSTNFVPDPNLGAPDTLVANPGIGIVHYPWGDPSRESLNFVNGRATYIHWIDFEPTERDYKWSFIDDQLNTLPLGRKLWLAIPTPVSLIDSTKTTITPSWVFTAGADYVNAYANPNYRIPVWWDPIFLAKLEQTIAAIAARYDGDPRLAGIQIQGQGHFGEMVPEWERIGNTPWGWVDGSGVWLPKAGIVNNDQGKIQFQNFWHQHQLNVIALYMKYFKKTPLNINIINDEVGWVSNSTNPLGKKVLASAVPLYGMRLYPKWSGAGPGQLMVGVPETFLNYTNQTDVLYEEDGKYFGWCGYYKDASGNYRCGNQTEWHQQALDIMGSRASYLYVYAADFDKMISHNYQPEMIFLAKHMGPQLYIANSSLININANTNQTVNITMRWGNRGNMSLRRPSNLVNRINNPNCGLSCQKDVPISAEGFIDLVNNSTGQTAYRFRYTPVKPTTQWYSNQITTDVVPLVIPSSVPQGQYTMRAGLFNPHPSARTGQNSTDFIHFKLLNTAPPFTNDDTDRYNIGTITVSNSGGNQLPQAVATANPTSGNYPLTVSFSSAGSSDSDGSIVSFHWDFGDNQTSSQANPNHTYSNPGMYTATLTVTDNQGGVGTASVVINATDPNQPVNLALGKTVYASAEPFSGAGYGKEKAVDGDNTTRWNSGQSDSEWLTVDLGSSVSVNKVVLNWESTYRWGRAYRIQVSSDNSNWIDVFSRTGWSGGIDTINFTATNARYVRLQGVTRNAEFYSLYEFEVYGNGGGNTCQVSSNNTIVTSGNINVNPGTVTRTINPLWFNGEVVDPREWSNTTLTNYRDDPGIYKFGLLRIYDWPYWNMTEAQMDTAVRRARQQGIEPIVVFSNENLNNPSFLVGRVQHFQGDIRVNYYQFGAEPDWDDPSTPGPGWDMVTFTNAFNTAYDAIKSVDPTVKVGGPVTSSSIGEFTRYFLENAGNRTDFVSTHMYLDQSIGHLQTGYLDMAVVVKGWMNQYISDNQYRTKNQVYYYLSEWDHEVYGLPFSTYLLSPIYYHIKAGVDWTTRYQHSDYWREDFSKPWGYSLYNQDDSRQAQFYYHQIIRDHLGEQVVDSNSDDGQVLVLATKKSASGEVNVIAMNMSDQNLTKNIAMGGVAANASVNITLWNDQTYPPQQVATRDLSSNILSYTLPARSTVVFTVTSSTSTAKEGDVNGDCEVDFRDALILFTSWFSASSQADVNKDSKVNSIDFALVIKNWGR